MKPSFLELLRVLDRFRVDYVVVGGVAAILEGAPITTFDLDIVYGTAEDNLHRLADSLSALDAEYRDPGGRQIEPTVDRLRTNRVNLLQTRNGPLDAMQSIGDGWVYTDLMPTTHRREVGGLTVRVLDLESVIRSKEDTGRDKDLAMLPVLRRTLELRRESDD